MEWPAPSNRAGRNLALREADSALYLVMRIEQQLADSKLRKRRKTTKAMRS